MGKLINTYLHVNTCEKHFCYKSASLSFCSLTKIGVILCCTRFQLATLAEPVPTLVTQDGLYLLFWATGPSQKKIHCSSFFFPFFIPQGKEKRRCSLHPTLCFSPQAEIGMHGQWGPFIHPNLRLACLCTATQHSQTERSKCHYYGMILTSIVPGIWA